MKPPFCPTPGLVLAIRGEVFALSGQRRPIDKWGSIKQERQTSKRVSFPATLRRVSAHNEEKCLHPQGKGGPLTSDQQDREASERSRRGATRLFGRNTGPPSTLNPLLTPLTRTTERREWKCIVMPNAGVLRRARRAQRQVVGGRRT